MEDLVDEFHMVPSFGASEGLNLDLPIFGGSRAYLDLEAMKDMPILLY